MSCLIHFARSAHKHSIWLVAGGEAGAGSGGAGQWRHSFCTLPTDLKELIHHKMHTGGGEGAGGGGSDPGKSACNTQTQVCLQTLASDVFRKRSGRWRRRRWATATRGPHGSCCRCGSCGTCSALAAAAAAAPASRKLECSSHSNSCSGCWPQQPQQRGSGCRCMSCGTSTHN